MFRARGIALLLVLTTMLVYLPSLRNDFLVFDDDTYLTENANVQHGLTGTSLKWAFTTFDCRNWHPLTWIVYTADYQMFRQNPAGHHFVNLLFHSANAGLLFWLMLRLTGGLWLSAFIAALFAWHPLHVESVAWIAELKDVMSTFWGLLSLLAYVRYARGSTDPAVSSAGDLGGNKAWGLTAGRHRFYWLTLVFFALSLMSKPMLVTLPFIMLLLDYWPLQRDANVRRCLLEKIPFLLLTVVACVLTAQAQKLAPLDAVPFSLRLDNAIVAYAEYLWKMAWPASLVALYPFPHSVPSLNIALSTIALAGLSTIAFWAARQQPWLPVGWLWYAGSLVPVIGLIHVGSQSMADRYTYFPLIGIFMAGTLSIANLAGRFKISKTYLVMLAAGILTACVFRTECQLAYWRNTETLFRHVLDMKNDNMLAHLVLGNEYERQGQFAKAMTEYHQALLLNNQRPDVYQRIGILLVSEGKYPEALEYFQKALQLNPDSAVLHDSAAIQLMRLGRFAEAKQHCAEAIRADGNYAAAYFRMGCLLLRSRDYSEAKRHFLAAIKLEPQNTGMLVYIARILAAEEATAMRDGQEACQLAKRAVELTGGNQPVALDTLAAAYAESNLFVEAAKIEQQAIELAQKLNSQDDIGAMQQRLELYQNQHPYRESFEEN